MTILRLILVCALLGLAASACTTVQPWERGRLAHDCMQIPVDDAETAYYGHLELVREGSMGGATAGGGGCGCS